MRRRVSSWRSARFFSSYLRAMKVIVAQTCAVMYKALQYTSPCIERRREVETRIDHITGGIYRIATMTAPYGITFNQFLIDDERPALVHTGEYGFYEPIRKA